MARDGVMSAIAMISPGAVKWWQNCACEAPSKSLYRIDQASNQGDSWTFKLTHHPAVCSQCETPYVMVVDRKKVAVITDVQP